MAVEDTKQRYSRNAFLKNKPNPVSIGAPDANVTQVNVMGTNGKPYGMPTGWSGFMAGSPQFNTKNDGRTVKDSEAEKSTAQSTGGGSKENTSGKKKVDAIKPENLPNDDYRNFTEHAYYNATAIRKAEDDKALKSFDKVKPNAWLKSKETKLKDPYAEYLQEYNDDRLQRAMEYRNYASTAGTGPHMTEEEWNKAHPIEQRGVNTPTPDTRSAYQKFRDSMYDEDKIRKQSNTRARIMALRDAIVNIGNLGTTIAGATPQNFGSYLPSVQERQSYEAGKQARDAKAQQVFGVMQTEAANKAKAAIDEAKARADIDAKEGTRAYKEAATKKILQDININAAMFEPKYKKMLGDLAITLADADKAEADAKEAKVRAAITEKYGPAEAEAKIAHIKAQSASAYASAAASYANAEESRESAAEKRNKRDEPTTAPVFSNGKYDFEYEWDLGSNKDENTRKNIASALARRLRQQGWLKESEDGGTISLEEIYARAMEHADDPGIQAVLATFGKKVRKQNKNKQPPTERKGSGSDGGSNMR